MSKVTDQTLTWAHKPYDIVSDKEGNVGFIREVSVNSSQDTPEAQITYAVTWLVGTNYKSAWFSHSELNVHCNLFKEIAKCSCHPMGTNARAVDKLFSHIL